jgi:endonuclease I
MRHVLFSFLFLTIICASNAQIPDGYYDGTDGLTGQALKVKLHQIIRAHKVRTYAEFRDVILKDLDEDPNNPDNIILFYKNNSIPKGNFASNNQQDFWNREHTWPKSHGFPGTADTAYTDVHNLRPSDASVNTSKSNKDFNDVEHIPANEEGEAPDTYTNSDFWEPRDEIKGDVARILMYMDVRYESNSLDLELVDNKTFSGDPELGVLFTLLRWHLIDPVDDAERARHDKAYGYQLNRNPFVDHPEYVSAIWGDASEPFVTADQSSFNADFGSVTFGESFAQSYVINAYNLEADLNLSVNAPFYLSNDGQNFSNSLTFSHESGQTSESFTVHVKFEPQQADGQKFTESIIHQSTNMTDFNLEVVGLEGEATLMTIEQARTKSLGTVVDVTGVILGGENHSSRSRVLYDGTAGIVIRSPDEGTNETAPLVIGDSVVVSGALTEYANLLQINGSPMSVTLISKNATLPEPKELTISEIGENYESQLVVIRDITFTHAGQTFKGGGEDGNFEITDATGALALRIGNAAHPLVGTTIPSGLYDLIGYIGQFVDDYQISPRGFDDIIPVDSDPTPSDLITILEARSKPEGEVVKVKGIVIGGENNNAVNRVLYDGTAGLVIRGLNIGHLSSELVMGDSVEVSGGILDYNGLFELEEDVKISLLNGDNTLPEAQEITLAELGEEYESELILLKGVSVTESGTFSAGNFTLSDNSGTATMRIGTSDHPLIGTSIPSGSFDLIAYVGQDGPDYQVFTRLTSDLSNVVNVLAKDAKPKLDLIYPNPVRKDLNLNIPYDHELQVGIYDLEGRLIIERLTTDRKIDVSDIDRGIYLVIVRANDVVSYSKLIKR